MFFQRTMRERKVCRQISAPVAVGRLSTSHPKTLASVQSIARCLRGGTPLLPTTAAALGAGTAVGTMGPRTKNGRKLIGKPTGMSQSLSRKFPHPPVKLPAAFRSDGDFLEKNAIGGHQLFKRIQSTPWTVKKDLAGRPIQHLRVVDLARKGIEEYSLRLISEGTSTSLKCHPEIFGSFSLARG